MVSHMTRARGVTVSVPATSANLGSGFDTMGLALAYRDETVFTFDPDGGHALAVSIHGEGERTLPCDASNLVARTFLDTCHKLGWRGHGSVSMRAHNRIPQARGLGSSAEAIVMGIAGAAGIMAPGDPRERHRVFTVAVAIEGHPDNVAPAVYGGLTAACLLDAEGTGTGPRFTAAGYAVSPHLRAAVFVPDTHLSTARARGVLPAQVPYRDAVFNVSRVGLMPAAMQQSDGATGNAMLFAVTQDALHQRYRKELMPDSWQLLQTLRTGGLAAAVSGAGPCVLVLHYGDVEPKLKRLAAERLASRRWRLLCVPIDQQGVSVAPVSVAPVPDAPALH